METITYPPAMPVKGDVIKVTIDNGIFVATSIARVVTSGKHGFKLKTGESYLMMDVDNGTVKWEEVKP